jgi:hypothetical protein
MVSDLPEFAIFATYKQNANKGNECPYKFDMQVCILHTPQRKKLFIFFL